MPRKLDFSSIDEADVEELAIERTRRWASREPNPVVQMSLRMPVETYDRFRALCKRERRTNGDMLRVLMEGYLDRSTQSGGDKAASRSG